MKKASRLQKVDMITELGNKQTKKKRKRKRKQKEGATYCFISITSFSFGFLEGWVSAAVVDTWALSLGSSFGGMVRVANTSSML